MKKVLILAAFVLLVSASAFSQKIVMANYTDTLSGAQTKYYAAPAQGELVYGSFGIYVDHLSGSTDSTYVTVQGSYDGVTYLTLVPVAYSTSVTIGSTAPTDFYTARFYTTDGGVIWNIQNVLTLPYYRFAVTHYATGTVRVKGGYYKKLYK
jgi:hypothetical protein